MMNALYISAIGLQAQKEQLDAIAANFSNANTTAYKRRTVDFAAVLDLGTAPRAAAVADTAAPAEARPARVVRFDLAQGELRGTGRALDVALNGSGFIEVELGGGATGYTRGGSLQVNADGLLALPSGLVLKADVRVPTGATAVSIDAAGQVSATLEGERTPTVLGQIELVSFANPEALDYSGEGVFVPRANTAEPTRLRPGEAGAGRLVPSSLEGSNVRMVDETVALMLMQRVYELNTKVVQAADEMMALTNGIRRG
jgi:flagellar basal-body rod protein FlgG